MQCRDNIASVIWNRKFNGRCEQPEAVTDAFQEFIDTFPGHGRDRYGMTMLSSEPTRIF